MLALLCLVLPMGSGCSEFVQTVATPSGLIARPLPTPQRLRVSGTAQGVAHRISRTGNPYDVFFLCEGACIRIYAPVRTQVQNGNRVSAIGTFYAQRKVGRTTFYNEVEAEEVVIER